MSSPSGGSAWGPFLLAGALSALALGVLYVRSLRSLEPATAGGAPQTRADPVERVPDAQAARGAAAVLSPVFLDNADAQGVAILGSWVSSAGARDAYKDSFLHDNNSSKGEKSVRFTPLLPQARNYSVFLRWPAGGAGRASNVPIVITHGDGVASLTVNQQLDGGAWRRIGNYRFAAGRRGSVLISNTGTGGSVVADAVLFAPELDLSALPLTFSEEFDALPEVSDHSDWQHAHGKWFAGTPYTGDGYGDARFGGAAERPFAVASGVLSIRAAKSKRGWVSGMLSSARPDGSGFLQRYGYFEARMKFAAGMGTWPAFWLLSAGSLATPKRRYGEIDVVEFYGNQPDTAYAAAHVWQRIGSEQPGGALQPSTIAGLSTDFHSYAVLVRADFTTWYVDGIPQFQMHTLPENEQPLYLMVCFALGGGWPTYGVADPSFLQVDYVRAYAVPP